MKQYFDEYFDMVYFINIPNRKDKYENVMQMFKKLNITKWKHIIPKDPRSLVGDYELGKTAMSCKLAHLECYQEAVDLGYEQICIFEDDFCFNLDDPSIEENLEYHLEVCFSFMKRVNWSLFYFDNIAKSMRENNVMLSYTRFQNEQFPIMFMQGKRFTHSYALSIDACKKMIELIHSCDNSLHKHVDFLLAYSGIKTAIYTKGIFDQLVEIKSDNDWESNNINITNFDQNDNFINFHNRS